MSTKHSSYVSISNILEYWQNKIAPTYLDFDNTNNYRAGLFGYINEVMANATEDAFNAINIARREFYPITAQNQQSLYKMATIHRLPLPTTTPAICKAFLIIPQQEIISKSTFKNGVYTCVIDNSMKLLVDNIPFMLDYPIVIVSKKVGSIYSHTAHYDISLKNSISTTTSKYIMNLVIPNNGVNYLSLGVTMRQVSNESISQIITKDSNIDIVSLDFNFDGSLANFEVYYSTDGGNTEIQLPKLLYGSPAMASPFVYYKMIDDNTIRLIFPKNAYFTPAFNSEVRLDVFTSLGDDGNFESFSGDIVAQIASEKYPYNNTMTITGKVNGGSHYGKNKKSDAEFQQEVIKAYSTNNTITTTNDLQLYFNGLGASSKNKILFRKKRDDALYHIFGAYSLLKDASDNVVPTNTVNVHLNLTDFEEYTPNAQRAILKPGTLFEYNADANGNINYSVKKVTDLSLIDELGQFDDNSRFLFTSPFLIAVTMNPNVVGFYLNSIQSSFPIEYSYVNDETYIQFIGSALSVQRNSMEGSNFYKMSINITPSTDIDMNGIVTKSDITLAQNIIRAKKDGKVISCKYIDDHIVTTLKYIDNTTEDIISNNYVTYTPENGIVYHTGFNIHFTVGSKFVSNDIVATKKDVDNGKLRLMGDIIGVLTDNDLYIPFVLDTYDEANGICTFSAYVATNDYMTLDAKMLITRGIYNSDGTMNTDVSIPMSSLSFKISTFYKNDDVNYKHIYAEYNFYKNYTLTNAYTVAEKISLIQQIDFVRSTLKYIEGATPGSYSVILSEIPVAKANWVKNADNLKYLINIIRENYSSLMVAYYLLENNFGIDLKFFNTYGKSRFYRVGIKDTSTRLNSVNCSFNFGVALTSLSSVDVFMTKFRNFVKEYIESLNDVANNGHSIYIMNLITELKSNFSEISYLEYYGMNSYSHEAQKIEPLDNSEITSDITEFIPEFINIHSYNEGNVTIPKINITILEQ